MTDENVDTQMPDGKYWPGSVDVIEVNCPWCGRPTQSCIGVAREIGSPGRDDDCQSCGQTIIVEAFEHGIVAVRAVVGPAAKPNEQRLVRLTHYHTTLSDSYAVRTAMSLDTLNEIIAYLQLVRDELPICELADDVIGENEVSSILAKHFGCERVISSSNIDCIEEIDIHSNWDLACTLANEQAALYERMPVRRSVVAAAILDEMIEQAEHNATRHLNAAQLAFAKRFGYDEEKGMVMLERLKLLRDGAEALPEWDMQTVANDPIVGRLV